MGRLKYAAKLAEARKLSEEDARWQLQSLCEDPRFLAVIAWLDGTRDKWVQAVGHPTMAEDPGKLAHAAGSLAALNGLLNYVGDLLAPTAGPPQAPPPDDA